MKLSTGLRNALMGSDSLKDLLDGSTILIYSGSVPTSADSALPGDATLLVEIKTTAPAEITFDPTIVGGTLTKNASETWEGTVATAGSATFFRLVKPADTGSLSTTAIRVQGTAGVGSQDLQLATSELIATTTQRISFFNITLPEGS